MTESSKRLERGRFVWPSIADGKLTISPAQLAMFLEEGLLNIDDFKRIETKVFSND